MRQCPGSAARRLQRERGSKRGPAENSHLEFPNKPTYRVPRNESEELSLYRSIQSLSSADAGDIVDEWA